MFLWKHHQRIDNLDYANTLITALISREYYIHETWEMQKGVDCY